MCYRTKDIGIVNKAIHQYAEHILGLEPEVWLNTPGNLALTNEKEDVALFERQYRSPQTVCGHYFFHSRGKEARDSAIEMLKEAFTGPYSIETIIGLTPVEHKGALRMNKFLGLTEYGVIDTDAGPCQFVMITKKDWENNQ